MKTIKIDVLIIIEHIARELESACLLKSYFLKKGFTVAIDGIYPSKERLPFKYCGAKIIILPWCYHNLDMKYARMFMINSPGALLLNMHHEEYTVRGNGNFLVPREEAVKLCHVSWGRDFTDKMLHAGCKAENIVESGNIRLDFFKGKLKEGIKSKKELALEYGLDENKKWSLYIADASHISSRALTEEEEKSMQNSPGVICRRNFLEFVDKYLSEKDDVVFIYRPHPVLANKDLPREDLKRLAEKYPNNFKAISDYAINCWIVSCDTCFSYQSTSAIECVISGNQYYLFRTVEVSPDRDYEFFEDYPNVVHDYDGFLGALKCQKDNYDVLKGHFSKYYNISNDYSYITIGDFLMEKLNNKEFYCPGFKMKDFLEMLARFVIKELMIIFSNIPFIKEQLLKKKDNRIYRIVGKGEDNVTAERIKQIEKRLGFFLNE